MPPNLQALLEYQQYHANCPEATAKYYALVFVAKSFEKGSEQYEKACLRYKWHIARCCNCREGLDAS